MKKRYVYLILFIAFLLANRALLSAQEAWIYNPDLDILFPEPDSIVVPFLCAVDNKDNLWVISSSTSAPGAINALYKAAPGERTFTLIDDYTNNLNVESTRGITVIGDTVYISCRKPGTPVPQTSLIYEYPNGDVNARKEFSGAGYGTWVQGLSASRDKYIYAGIAYLTSIRVYDFTDESASRGLWVPIDPLSAHPNEPGGHDGSSLVSKIRDVAVIPGADYSDPSTPFFTSRESDTTGASGGIAIWTGGTQTTPKDYSGLRVSDVASDLSWKWWTPYGITCDSAGNLYACGTDTLRSWVKSFAVFGSFAIENEELPGRYSKSSPDPNGAPMISPTDVALRSDEKVAYVTDMEAHRVFVFTRGTVGIEESMAHQPVAFHLYANYPNPFNAQTTIRFDLDKAERVELSIFNIWGQKVATILNEEKTAGTHQVHFDAADLTSGIYYYRLSAGGQSRAARMLLIK